MSKVRDFLTESASTMKKFGANTISDYKMILAENTLYEAYKESLAEGLEGEVRESFMTMADMVREPLLTETAYGFSPIAPLTMPIFRRMWPMLVIREAVTVLPMDKPDITKAFMRIVATVNGNEVEMPNNTTPVSNGRSFGEINNIDMPPYEIVIGSNNGQTDLLKLVDPSFTPQVAHVSSADFLIVSVKVIGASEGEVTEQNIYVEPEDNGAFSFDVNCGGTGGTTYTDTVSGKIDYFTGIFTISSTRYSQANYKVKSILLTGSVTQAEEMISNSVNLKYTYVKFHAEDQELQASWSIQFEQDTKAYFDMDVQTQLVDNMGKIIAMDIDRKLINKIIRETEKFNPTSCGTGVSGDRFTFDRKPSANFAFGQNKGHLVA